MSYNITVAYGYNIAICRLLYISKVKKTRYLHIIRLQKVTNCGIICINGGNCRFLCRKLLPNKLKGVNLWQKK